MSFDKDYPNRKDWRTPYHKSKRFDRSCRPGGNCGWCESNRTIVSKKLEEKVKDEIKGETHE